MFSRKNMRQRNHPIQRCLRAVYDRDSGSYIFVVKEKNNGYILSDPKGQKEGDCERDGGGSFEFCGSFQKGDLRNLCLTALLATVGADVLCLSIWGGGTHLLALVLSELVPS